MRNGKPEALLLFILAFAFPAMAAAVSPQCLVPLDSLHIDSSATLCPGTYAVSGITIKGVDITLLCQGTVLKGSQEGAGVTIENSASISIENCTITSFEAGIAIRNSSLVSARGNTLDGNKFGIAVLGSSEVETSGNLFLNSARDDILTLPSPDSPLPLADGKASTTLAPARVLERHLRIKEPDATQEKIQSEVALLENRLSFARGSLNIRHELSFDAGRNETTILLILTPRQPLANVSVYESIPKCIAEYLHQIEFPDQNFEVIEEDPLIMWSFSQLSSRTELSYKVLRNLAPGCAELLSSFALAQSDAVPQKDVPAAKKHSSVILPLAVLGIIALFAMWVFWRRKKLDNA